MKNINEKIKIRISEINDIILKREEELEIEERRLTRLDNNYINRSLLLKVSELVSAISVSKTSISYLKDEKEFLTNLLLIQI